MSGKADERSAALKAARECARVAWSETLLFNIENPPLGSTRAAVDVFKDIIEEAFSGVAVSTPRCPKCGGNNFWLQCNNARCDFDLDGEGAAEFFQPAPSPQFFPMATAPKDGTEVLLRVKSRAGILGKYLVGHWQPGGHCIEDHPPIESGWYFWNGCLFDKASEPIGWQPLPAAHPPQGESK